MNSELAFLLRIQQACRDLLESAGESQSVFEAEHMRQAAVMYDLIVAGEAAKRLTSRFGPNVTWSLRQAARTRDRLAHEVFETKLTETWLAITVEVPLLLAQIESLLNANGQGNH